MYGVRDIISRADARIRGLDFRYVPLVRIVPGDGREICETNDYADSRLWLRRFFHTISKQWQPDPLDEAIDVGCGKAGAVSVLARYFARADGIDISPALITIGRENLRRMRVRNASLMVVDAAQFRDFDRYNFVYMFNPFPRGVMENVVANLNHSLRRKPRPVTVLYLRPLDIELFQAAGFSKEAEVYPDRADYPFVLLISPPQSPAQILSAGTRAAMRDASDRK